MAEGVLKSDHVHACPAALLDVGPVVQPDDVAVSKVNTELPGILGGDGEVSGGGGGLTSLLEQLTSQLGSSDQDDGDGDEEDT